MPDALIPVDVAPAWDPYPMWIEPRSNGIVWIDLEVPRDQRAGTYRGTIDVRGAGGALASLPVELEVVDATLPDRTVGAMLPYDHEALVKRVGPYAEPQLFQLLHAHRIAPMHDATSDSDVHRQAGALDGSLYTRSMGYYGPAPAMGDGVLAVGAFGAFGEPDERSLVRVEEIARAADDLKLFGATDVFFFAGDEQCSSAWGGGWRKLLRGSDDASARRLRVAWTCSMDPTAQPVDVPIVRAAYDPAQVREARAQGKETWVYDGVQPRTGTFLLDADAVSPRVNGWLSAMFRVPRWTTRESTRWYAAHGDVPVDPFVDPEWLLGDDAGWANGQGVLLYPGQQLDAFPEHSLGFAGVIPSFRLKNWRRGIEDAGYLQMARARDAAKADAIARWLVPAAFGEARTGEAPSWSPRGKPFFDARRALLAVVLGRTPVALGETPATRAPEVAARAGAGCMGGATENGVALGLLMCVGAAGMARARRRSRSAA